jgi:TRAP-type C4-dicarboxylate transport system permease small subunit
MNRLFDRVRNYTERISFIGFVTSGIAIVLMVFLLIIEVLVRTIFAKSTYVAQEFTSYLLLYFAFFSLAHILKEDRHINIGVVTSRLSEKFQKILTLMVYIFSIPVVVYMIYWTANLTIVTYQRMEISETIFETPLFVPKLFMPVGLLIFALQLIVSTVDKIRMFNK